MRLLLDPMAGRGVSWRGVLFVVGGSVLLWQLLQLVKWLSVWQSLLSDSLLSGLSRSLAVTTAVFVVGALPLCVEFLRWGGDAGVLQRRALWCCGSPLLVWLAHTTRLLRWRGGGMELLLMDLVGLVLWVSVMLWLRGFCLRLFGGERACDVDASCIES